MRLLLTFNKSAGAFSTNVGGFLTTVEAFEESAIIMMNIPANVAKPPIPSEARVNMLGIVGDWSAGASALWDKPAVVVVALVVVDIVDWGVESSVKQ